LSRSVKKGPFLSASLFIQRLFSSHPKINNSLKSRYSVVTPDIVGDTFQIYTGRLFSKIKISDKMVGKKLGEFAVTRKAIAFLTKKSQKSRNKR